MNIQETILDLKGKVELFLEKLVDIEEKRLEIFDKIFKLEQIVFGKEREYWPLEQRFSALENWFVNEGKKLLESKLDREHLERIILCMEKIRSYEDNSNLDLENISKMSNVFLRAVLRKIGLEYTPLGLVETQKFLTEEAEILRKLKTEIEPSRDVKINYERFLSYQSEMLSSFYKPEEHLFTILDHQLKNLEANFSKEDEFFVASLLYYLKMNNYKIAPYFERFRKITSAKSEKK
jgi:hypothetical protein